MAAQRKASSSRPPARRGKAPAASSRRPAARPKEGPVDVMGAGYVFSVFGPFGSSALVVMSSERAADLVRARELEPAPAFLVDAVVGELEDLEAKRPGVKSSALAATALALALEISSPAASSTSKSMLAARLMEAMEKLAAVAPPAEEADGLDEIKRQREKRLAQARKAAGA